MYFILNYYAFSLEHTCLKWLKVCSLKQMCRWLIVIVIIIRSMYLRNKFYNSAVIATGVRS